MNESDEDAAPERAADSRRVAAETVERLRRQLERLDGDPAATPRERAQVATALTSATRLLAKVSGALDVSPRQIVSSPHWRAIVAALVEALAPYPEAAEAAAKAIATIGATS
ncbi:MAG: hypothetical protein ACRENE_25835 [Polyangiaceae bacterium]